ncbi:MAG: NADPH:quinone reductase-like Zn-dependent oxidoreductase [Chlamydiales bacterium]|jgi:NADPH:quinone reductase-like Zn-dependent oxidoreductase
MKAACIDKFGQVDTVEFKEQAVPNPKANELLLRVAYAGVNPVDWKICEGQLKEMMPHEFPITLGWDMSGVVTEIGKNVQGFTVGDEVYAYCRKESVHDGSFSEYICLDASHVAPKPSSLSFAQAACIPLTGLTAWQSLFDFCGLQKGQNILIHAGAGGVGSLAIQFAKHAGAFVITTARKKNHDYVTKLGADWVIDYSEEDFDKAIKERFPTGLELVFDCAGGETLIRSYPLVKENGCLVSIVEPPNESLLPSKTIKSGFVFVSPNSQQLKEIGALFDSGVLILPEIQELLFSQVKEALEESRKGHVRGKIALKISEV